jgi:hypothetical protein
MDPTTNLPRSTRKRDACDERRVQENVAERHIGRVAAVKRMQRASGARLFFHRRRISDAAVASATPRSMSIVMEAAGIAVAGETVSVAVACVLVASAFADVTAPAGRTFVIVPFALAVTSTLTEQDELAGMTPPVNVSELDPATAVTVPPHVDTTLGALAFTRFAGYESTNAAPVMACVFGLPSVIVSREIPPTTIVVGSNVFAAEGAGSPAVTVSISTADWLVPNDPSPEYVAVML